MLIIIVVIAIEQFPLFRQNNNLRRSIIDPIKKIKALLKGRK